MKCERNELHGEASHYVWADDAKKLGLRKIAVCADCALHAYFLALNVAPIKDSEARPHD